ncbi:PACE efflux transporter [Vibrio kasasachensis]|uniref:PACE efflux transporter n=1 Tax=Vibrio kasasachensis TaxID=2910248 RepID=UPI003D0DB980
MQTKERIFHAISFEVIAIAIMIPTMALLTGKATGDLAIVGIGFSLLTVVWNYFYNIMFDRRFGSDRSQRSLKLRVGHTFGFEAGLIFVSVPTIAWFLQISIFAALALEAGLLVFFFFYATGFNWCYDRIQPFKWLFGRKVKAALH